MSSFLTVEDINSVLLEYGDINTFHKIALGNVGSERQEYIDFCNISCNCFILSINILIGLLK